MNPKKIVQKQINDLVVAIAELYNPVIDEDCEDEEFEIIAGAVAEERDQVIDNLLVLVEVIVEDIQKEAKVKEVKKAARLRKLIPSDISVPEPAPIAPEPAPVAPPVPSAPPVMEHTAPLPRSVSGADVTEATTALELPDNLMEVAREAIVDDSLIPITGSGEIYADDVTTNDDFTHNLGMTIAEQKRQAQGLPVKLNRPTVHVGLPKPTVAPEPTVVKEVPAPETNFTLEEIEEEARGK